MGLALEGSPLNWKDSENAGQIARRYAAKQILALWLKQRHRHDSESLWGDEIEFSLVELDAKLSRASVLLDQERVIKSWEKNRRCQENPGLLQWEWASYVVEATPVKPYSERISDLIHVEKNMRCRRELVGSFLGPDQHAMSLSMFPRAGVEDPWTTPSPPTEILSSQPRYTILTDKFKNRAGGCAKTWLPIYRDRLTQSPFIDEVGDERNRENHICLDQLYMGIGCCSIQTTFQTSDETEARWLHDQLIPLCPIFLAMTAATPAWKGYLVDSDTRWQRYGDLVDDRSLDEKASNPPRWTWKQSYISADQPSGLKSHQMLHQIDEDIRKYLIEGGMDGFLADHFTSILTRDPLLLTEADLKNNEPPETRLFETLYGCVWHPVRFKPPTNDHGPGWRVEFRPMEAQLTDFENASFAIFAYLVSRAITVLRLKFYITVEELADAWAKCQECGAVIDGRFWFRKTGWLSDSDKINPDIIRMLSQHGYHYTGKESYAQMTVDEIVNGQSTVDGFPGFLLMVRCYFEYVGVPMQEQEQIAQYLNLIRDRASGTNPTAATWMREFISNHKDYGEDSFVSETVCYDERNHPAKRKEDRKDSYFVTN